MDCWGRESQEDELQESDETADQMMKMEKLVQVQGWRGCSMSSPFGKPETKGVACVCQIAKSCVDSCPRPAYRGSPSAQPHSRERE
jgi:hypothetical protein